MSRKISSFEADLAVRPIAEFLKGMAVDRDFLLMLSSHSKEWVVFGKMNSHLYRAELKSRMDKQGFEPYDSSETEDYKLDVMFSRTTASQLHLDPDMQALAKAGYLEYGSNVLKNADTKNQPGPSEMRNTLYKNLAADSYNLLLPNSQELMLEDTVMGYTEMELIAYIVFMMMVARKRERTNFLHLDYHDSSDVDKKRVSELIKVKVMNMLEMCLIAE
ncbi:hypothetical protein MYU51_001005 [Penicillium brevicompactum]